MVSDPQHPAAGRPRPDAAAGIAGERTVSAVAGEQGGRRLTRSHGIVMVVLAAGVAASFILFRPEVPREDPLAAQEAEALRVAERAPFEPARIAAAPLPLPAIQQVRQVAPPALPAEHQAQALPPTATPGEDPLVKARRAPLMAFGGQGTASTAPTAGPPGRLEPKEPGEQGNELAARLVPTRLEAVRAAQLGDRHLLVTQGTVIPCVLETALDSTLPGFATCVLPRDVLSATGSVVMLEKGTRVVGEFQGGMRQGQRRLFVLWTRAETPNGVVVDLASPATDALGRSGFDGAVDTRFWERFGGALLLSILSDGIALGTTALAGDGAMGGYLAGRTFGTGQSAAAEALRNTINIPPVLRKNQGEEVAIFVARDLDFSSVYDLSPTAAGYGTGSAGRMR